MIAEMMLILAVIVFIGVISALLEIKLGGCKVWNYFMEENGNAKYLSKMVMVAIVILALMPNLVNMTEETAMTLFYAAFSFGAALGIKSFRLGGKNSDSGK